MARWDVIPNERVANHGALFDMPGDKRQGVDIETLALTDQAGSEIPVYTYSGVRQPRRTPRFRVNQKSCGLLLNLDRVRAIFTSIHADDYDSEFEMPPSGPNISMYRQAFLHNHGHIQAHDAPTAVLNAIRAVNKMVGLKIESQSTDSDSDSDDPHAPVYFQHRPVSAIFSQVYNGILHRSRPDASQHDAQQGNITSAAAGPYALGEPQKRTASKKFSACAESLPHQKFAQRINNPDLDTDLRIESNFMIDIRKLAVTQRRGE